MITRFRFLLLIFLVSSSSASFARDLKIIFPKYTPPYVLENDTGILVDLVRTALADHGYTVSPVAVPIGRGIKMFANHQADGTTIIQESTGLQTAYSKSFMQYHNRVFALKSNKIFIHTLSDLQGKTIIAFQNAHQYLGKAFGDAMKDNPKYEEMAQQEGQVRMLLLGRADLIILDESIFRYYWKKVQSEAKVKITQDYVAFDLFPPTPYTAAFIDAKVRDDFETGIAAMRKDGRYDAIYQKYAKQYFAIQQ